MCILQIGVLLWLIGITLYLIFFNDKKINPNDKIISCEYSEKSLNQLIGDHLELTKRYVDKLKIEEEYKKNKKLIGKKVGHYNGWDYKTGKLSDIVKKNNMLEYHIKGYGCVSSIKEIKK